MDQNRIILEISPQTTIKLASGAMTIFYVPEDCPKDCGLPRRSADQPMVTVKTMKTEFPDLYEVLGGENYKPRKRRKEIRYGCPHCLSQEGLGRKRRIERWQKYRDDLAFLAKKAGFELPVWGWSLYFYIPMPKTWPKKKREAFKGQPNWSKPDCKNYLSVFEDALSKTDERNSQMSGLGKFWIDRLYIDENGEKQKGCGYIEILLNQTLYNPFNVVFLNQDEYNNQSKRKWTKREPGDPLKRKPKKLVSKKFKKEDKIR